jgi:hypothetical protein
MRATSELDIGTIAPCISPYKQKRGEPGFRTGSPWWTEDVVYYKTWDREGSLTRRPEGQLLFSGTAIGAVDPDSLNSSWPSGRSASLK